MARLPRLRRDERIIDGVAPSLKFQRDWQLLVEQIEALEAQVNDLESAIVIIQNRLAAAGIP